MAYENLTAKQLKFAKGVIDGMSGADAARSVGVTGTPRAIGERAKGWMRNPKVKAFIDGERKRIADALKEEDILSKKDMLQALGRIVKRKGKDARASSRDVTGAIAQASKMLGCDAPSKVEVKLEGSILHKIRNNR
jgi:phage terminase small subunit